MIELLTNRISKLKVDVQDQVDARFSLYDTPRPVATSVTQVVRPEFHSPAVAEILVPKTRSWDTSSASSVRDSKRSTSLATSVGDIQVRKTSWPSWQKEVQEQVTLSRGRGPGGLFY